VLLQAATVAILLIACANLANLLLGAGVGRTAELSVRTALGAGRMRIVRQLLTESLVLATVGGLFGTALAWLATSYLSAVAAPMLLPQQRIVVDLGVLLFAMAISIGSGMLFGLLPALHVTAGSLRESCRHTATPDKGRLRSALIVAEVAVSVTLLVGAVLLIRSFQQLTRVDPGFRAARVVSFQLAVQPTQYPEGTQSGFYEHLYDRIRTLPGVVSVGGVNILPMSGGYSCDGLQIEGHEVSNAQQRCAEVRSASPEYVQTMGIPLVRGRWFTKGDSADAPRVVVINEAMARQFFPGEDPIGRRVIYTSRNQNDPRAIVGIIGDVHHFALDTTPVPEFYTPQPQPPSYHGMTVVVRAHGDPAALMPAVRAEVRALAPDAPLYNVRTLEHLLDASVADARFRTLLLALFAALALVLAVVGTYGVISLVVTERTHEMGIRLALGAAPSAIMALVLRGGLLPLAAGTVLGLTGGLALSRAVAGLLYNVSPADPLTFLVVGSVIASAGVLAVWVPARRACRVDPAVALRSQ
jgi:putative ABC transport system permease protein